jgi:uncharacterized protein (DUF2141 family)
MSGYASGTKAEEYLMRTMMTVLLILFAPAVTAGELRITVEDIRSTRGTILLGLYAIPLQELT